MSDRAIEFRPGASARRFTKSLGKYHLAKGQWLNQIPRKA